MANPFPPEDEGTERVRFSVRFEEKEKAELKLVAAFWNEIDKATGKRRRSKWKPSSVIERFVLAQLDGFWEKIGGKGTLAEREEHLKRLVVQVEKDEAAKRPVKKSKKQK